MKSFLSFFKIKAKKQKSFWFVVLLIVLLFFVAYIHNNNIAYIVMFFIFSISLISMPIGRRNIKNINLELKHQPKVFANESFKYKALLSGNGFDINIQNQTHNIKDEKLIDLEYKFANRGVNIIKNEQISSLYPLGLVKFLKDIKLNKEILVYPELKGKSLEESFFTSNSSIGYKNEFEGIKSYSQSDSIADIHWPSVAKGEMVSKKFSYISESDTLVFDYTQLNGNKEDKLSQLALWSIEANNKGYKFIVKIGTEVLKDIDEILKKLALY